MPPAIPHHAILYFLLFLIPLVVVICFCVFIGYRPDPMTRLALDIYHSTPKPPGPKIEVVSFISAYKGGWTNLSRYEEYLLKAIKKPDEGSDFAKSIKWIRYIPDNLLWPLLKFLNYEALLLVSSESGEVIGHLAFQGHPLFNVRDKRVFSVFVKEQYRGKGYAKELVLAFLCSSYTQKIPRVRLGAGREDFMNWMCTCATSGHWINAGFWKKTKGGRNWLELIPSSDD